MAGNGYVRDEVVERGSGGRGRRRRLSRTRMREYKPAVGCMPVCNVGRKGLGGDFRKLLGGTVGSVGGLLCNLCIECWI